MTDQPKPREDGLKTSGDDFAKTPLSGKIGKNLKQIYDDVVNEDVPDDFLSLLEKADTQDS